MPVNPGERFPGPTKTQQAAAAASTISPVVLPAVMAIASVVAYAGGPLLAAIAVGVAASISFAIGRLGR